jgi:hypothetical protein
MKSFLRLFTVFSVAVSLPIFDALTNNINFFVAWNPTNGEILSVLAIIYLMIPIVLWLLIFFAEKINRVFGSLIKKIVFWFLLLLFILHLVLQIQGLNSIASLGLGALISLLALLLYQRLKHHTNEFIILFSILTFVFPAKLLYTLYDDGLFLTFKLAKVLASEVKNDIPVFLIVFDELPTITLLDSNRQINANLFPSIASLASDGTWFRNATTVSGSTVLSVPAILTGKYPKNSEKIAPTFENYPNNLFSLLGSKYRVHASESATKICSTSQGCDDLSSNKNLYHHNPVLPSLRLKISGILYDIGVLYLHLILAEDLIYWAPTIAGRSHDFGNFLTERNLNESLHIDPNIKYINTFINTIYRTPKKNQDSSLYFLHSMLPHVPWMHTPSGKYYEISPGEAMKMPCIDFSKELWCDSEMLVIQAYQRHILNTMYADKQLETILNSLKSSGIYSKSLIIFVADHGIRFQAGSKRRPELENDENYEMRGVPLIIKWPNRADSKILDINAKTIDILPTIADVLGISLRYELDGVSLQQSREGHLKSRSEANLYENNSALAYKFSIFNSLTSVQNIYQVGTFKNLVGKSDKEFTIDKSKFIKFYVDKYNTNQGSESNTSNFIPLKLSGTVAGECDHVHKKDIGISVNNTIVVTTSMWSENELCRFHVILPEYSLSKGKNTVTIYEILDGSQRLALIGTHEVTY